MDPTLENVTVDNFFVEYLIQQYINIFFGVSSVQLPNVFFGNAQASKGKI